MKKAQGISIDPRGFVRVGRRVDYETARMAGIDKLRSKCKQTDSGCLEYQGFTHKEGYGQMSFQGKAWRTHSLMYTLTKGPVPAGMVVMHKCDNPPCCNPDHLEIGTKADNNRDMAAKRRGKYQKATHCKHGHEFTPENTYVCKRGFRHCKRCSLIKCRLELGWTREQAESMPVTSPGFRPVGGSKSTPTPKPVRVLSMVGSSPRMRAYRARLRQKRSMQTSVE